MTSARSLRLALAVAIFMAAGWLMRGYITDDTFIHLRYAENLAQRGEFSFNPGQHTYGATSPLWIFGLALLLKLGLSPFAAATVFGGLSGLLVLVLVEKALN
ncbi:MAG: arabinofuranosyltransferase, partial [Candidatus Krumholzibacteriia bacterium]